MYSVCDVDSADCRPQLAQLTTCQTGRRALPRLKTYFSCINAACVSNVMMENLINKITNVYRACAPRLGEI